MKILVIKSDHSDVPLAEIRTNKKTLDFIVDNTNGYLPKLFQNSYQRMVDITKRSSHFQIEEPQKATVNLLRYVLDNGDVLELTSDGHTAILNGDLLAPEEKNAIFQAIKNGELNVARKTDVTQAIPIMPTQPLQPKPSVKINISPDVMDMIKTDQQKRAEAEEMASRSYDEEIEEKQLHDSEDSKWTRNMLYWLKYGDKQ